MLKSVYEKRVTTAGTQRIGAFGSLTSNNNNGRPTTQPGYNRTASVINGSASATSGLDNIETILTPSDSSNINRFKFDNQQY